MHVSYLQFLQLNIIDHRTNAIQHLPCCPIGERQAKHIVIIHPTRMCITYSFSQNMCLATARRGQNKVVATACLYYGNLTFVQGLYIIDCFHQYQLGSVIISMYAKVINISNNSPMTKKNSSYSEGIKKSPMNGLRKVKYHTFITY